MQTEERGGLRDVSTTTHEHPVDVLPLDAIEGRHRRRWGLSVRRAVVVEPANDVVDVGRLGQVVNSARAHGVERGRDAAVTSKHHDAGHRVEHVQAPDDVEPREARHAKIDDGALGGLRLGGAHSLFTRGDAARVEASLAQRANEPIAECILVVDDEDGSAFIVDADR